MKTLEDALNAGEAIKIERRERNGCVRYGCQTCRTWRPAFALRDLRDTTGSFSCDDCEARVWRAVS